MLNQFCGVRVFSPVLPSILAVWLTPDTTNARSVAPVYEASVSVVEVLTGRPLWKVTTGEICQPLTAYRTTGLLALNHFCPWPNGRL